MGLKALLTAIAAPSLNSIAAVTILHQVFTAAMNTFYTYLMQHDTKITSLEIQPIYDITKNGKFISLDIYAKFKSDLTKE